MEIEEIFYPNFLAVIILHASIRPPLRRLSSKVVSPNLASLSSRLQFFSQFLLLVAKLSPSILCGVNNIYRVSIPGLRMLDCML